MPSKPILASKRNALTHSTHPDSESASTRPSLKTTLAIGPAACILTVLFAASHAQAIPAGNGEVIFDNGVPDGSVGISNFQGEHAGAPHDRTVADDFFLEESRAITAVEMSGIWFSAAGAPGPLTHLRVRIWEDDGTGTPVMPFENTITDQEVEFTAEDTGNVYFGRPEVRYHAEISPVVLPGEEWFWIAIQPIGATDNFMQLSSAAGEENLTGEQIHLNYPDVGAPWPTPGNVVFGQHYDVTFRLFGEAPPPPECPWDFNGDGVVDGADLGQLLANWGHCLDCDDCPWDVTGDCTVDGADLGQLLANWGECP